MSNGYLIGAIWHEVGLLDDILYRDVGTCNDLVLRDANSYFSTGWTAFLVANRLHEQLVKLATPEFEPQKDIGHRIKRQWYNTLESEADQRRFFTELKIGYSWFQELFQTPWETLEDLYQEVENVQNNKEYALLYMGRDVAPDPDRGVHPLLPCALADVVALLADLHLRQEEEKGIETSASSRCKIENAISRSVHDIACVNLNVELTNEAHAEYGGLLGFWSQLFHELRTSKRQVEVREVVPLFYGDGRQDGSTVHRPSKGKYEYDAGRAKLRLMHLLKGDEGLMEAYRRWAGLLANKRDWRLQFFIRLSEHNPIALGEGNVWRDPLKGAWHKFVQWGCNRPSGM